MIRHTLIMKQVALLLLYLSTAANSFLIRSSLPKSKPFAPLFLEDWVADMIDDELRRLGSENAMSKEWMQRNKAAILKRLESDFVDEEDPNLEEFQSHKKDSKMALRDPQRYCADRCITTGNCDVFEDAFNLSPREVIQFCKECVLSEDEDPCDIPDGFYNDDDDDKLMP